MPSISQLAVATQVAVGFYASLFASVSAGDTKTNGERCDATVFTYQNKNIPADYDIGDKGLMVTNMADSIHEGGIPFDITGKKISGRIWTDTTTKWENGRQQTWYNYHIKFESYAESFGKNYDWIDLNMAPLSYVGPEFVMRLDATRGSGENCFSSLSNDLPDGIPPSPTSPTWFIKISEI